MKSSRFANQAEPPGLVLTPLLDMFTIILIFLIVSFKADDSNFKLNPDLKLPESSARSAFKPAVNLAITPKSLIVEKKAIVPLHDAKFDEKWHDQQQITPLVEKLKVYYENIHKNISDPEEADEKAIIIVQADKRISYDELYLVLRSAAIAGFVKYRLAIMRK